MPTACPQPSTARRRPGRAREPRDPRRRVRRALRPLLRGEPVLDSVGGGALKPPLPLGYSQHWGRWDFPYYPRRLRIAADRGAEERGGLRACALAWDSSGLSRKRQAAAGPAPPGPDRIGSDRDCLHYAHLEAPRSGVQTPASGAGEISLTRAAPRYLGLM